VFPAFAWSQTHLHTPSLSHTHTYTAAYPHGVVPVCNVLFFHNKNHTHCTNFFWGTVAYPNFTCGFGVWCHDDSSLFLCMHIHTKKNKHFFELQYTVFLFRDSYTLQWHVWSRWSLGFCRFFWIYREKINQYVTFIQYVTHENMSLGFCRIHKHVRKVNMNTTYLWTYLHVLHVYNM